MKQKLLGLFLCFNTIAFGQKMDSLFKLSLITFSIQDAEAIVNRWRFKYKSSGTNINYFGEKYKSVVYFERPSYDDEGFAEIAYYTGDFGVTSMIRFITLSEPVFTNLKNECKNKNGSHFKKEEITGNGNYVTIYNYAMFDFKFIIAPPLDKDDNTTYCLFTKFMSL